MGTDVPDVPGGVRLFVAVYPSAEALDHLDAFVDGLAVGRAASAGINARRSARRLLHVTLAFIGELPAERLVRATDAIGEAAAAMRPFELTIAGGGTFEGPSGTVLWAGVRAPLEGPALVVRRALTRHRVRFDPRPYRPHLTIARPGHRVDVAADLDALADYEGPACPIESVELVSSLPGPHPEYRTVRSWPLG
ncbi:RNA 2',3'-cyclic phosphodiesterase [Longispora sp. K20-0274]|uniref:RNA 2',3'-cyclic phosphodiesterase n=1 Tax=Longispora sp. K20-0274 TaxID=3088255 RepID=UPI003999904A